MSYPGSGSAPAGWHPDPQNPAGGLRWWDGSRWTEHVQPLPPSASPAPAWGATAATPQSGLGYPAGPASWTPYPQPAPSLARSNQASLVAIGVTALYLVLAAAAHVVFFGFLPLIMSIRAVSRREKLAPAAVVAAVVALIVGIGFFVAR